MPRVNRDLQRRMAARRERERRRPGGERRYNFGTPEADLVTDDEALLEEDRASVDTQTVSTRPAAVATVRGGARATAKPFSAYKDEYAYVSSDLRRVAAVVGGLLVALIVLYVVLPLLVH